MPRTIRVAVCNLQTGIGTTRGYWHYALTGWKYFLPHGSAQVRRAADFLREEGVDVALLTEAGGGAWRTRGVDQVALVADRTPLVHRAFFPTLVVGRRVNQGNAVCTRFPLTSGETHRLPGTGEARFLNHVSIELAGLKTHVFVTHLSLERDVRGPQIERIAEVVNRHEAPTLLAGDFNIAATTELELLASSRLQHVAERPTFPSWKPTRALDHLFCSDHFEIAACTAFDRFRFSDHLPLVVDLRVRAGERARG